MKGYIPWHVSIAIFNNARVTSTTQNTNARLSLQRAYFRIHCLISIVVPTFYQTIWISVSECGNAPEKRWCFRVSVIEEPKEHTRHKPWNNTSDIMTVGEEWDACPASIRNFLTDAALLQSIC
jgi:hypothetical protein